MKLYINCQLTIDVHFAIHRESVKYTHCISVNKVPFYHRPNLYFLFVVVFVIKFCCVAMDRLSPIIGILICASFGASSASKMATSFDLEIVSFSILVFSTTQEICCWFSILSFLVCFCFIRMDVVFLTTNPSKAILK